MADDKVRIGVEVDADGAVSELDDIADSVEDVGDSAEGASDLTERLSRSWSSFVGNLGADLIRSAAESIIEFAAGASEAAIQVEKLREKLSEFDSGNVDQVFERLLEVSDELGLVFETLQGPAVELADTLGNMGVPLETVSGILEGFATASKAAGDSSEDFAGKLEDLQKAAKDGVITEDELAKIAEDFPQALEALAEGLGVTVENLEGVAEQTGLTVEALEPMAAALEEALGEQAQANAEGLADEMVRVENAVRAAREQIGTEFVKLAGQLLEATGGAEGLALAFQGLNLALSFLLSPLKAALAGLEGFKNLFRDVERDLANDEAFREAAEHWANLGKAAEKSGQDQVDAAIKAQKALDDLAAKDSKAAEEAAEKARKIAEKAAEDEKKAAEKRQRELKKLRDKQEKDAKRAYEKGVKEAEKAAKAEAKAAKEAAEAREKASKEAAEAFEDGIRDQRSALEGLNGDIQDLENELESLNKKTLLSLDEENRVDELGRELNDLRHEAFDAGKSMRDLGGDLGQLGQDGSRAFEDFSEAIGDFDEVGLKAAIDDLALLSEQGVLNQEVWETVGQEFGKSAEEIINMTAAAGDLRDGLKEGLDKETLQPLTDLTETLGEIPDDGGGLQAIADGITQITEALATLAEGGGEEGAGPLTDLIESLAELDSEKGEAAKAIGAGITAIGEGITSITEALEASGGENPLTDLVDAFDQEKAQAATQFGEALGTISTNLEGMETAVSELIPKIEDELPAAFETAQETITAAVDGILEDLQRVGPVVEETTESLSSFNDIDLSGIIGQLGELLAQLDSVKEAAVEAKAALDDLGNADPEGGE